MKQLVKQSLNTLTVAAGVYSVAYIALDFGFRLPFLASIGVFDTLSCVVNYMGML